MDYQPLDHEYDAVPYAFLTHRRTHPNYLAVMGSILGMSPAAPENSRVLEVGCAMGGNIIPMAYSLPESEFLGIDYSNKQVQFGRDAIHSLGLENIKMECLDIVEASPALGTYDYIIAHGIYSWVPTQVRDSLMALFNKHLAPQGIAYISYNTYPGWHMMEIVRATMLFATRDLTDPKEIGKSSQDIVEFMIGSIPAGLTAYKSVFETYKNSMVSKQNLGEDEAIRLMLHDEIATVNDPVYFRDFAAQAGRHGLQYLTESNFAKVINPRLSPETLTDLENMSNNIVDFEQYLDLLNNRSFRRTLLVHESIDINRQVRPEQVTKFRFMSRVKPEADDVDLSPEVKVSFEGSDGAVFTTNHPLSKAALLFLSEVQPKAVPFDELIERAFEKIDAVGDINLKTEKLSVAASLLQAYSYSSSLVDFEMLPSKFVTEISKYPQSSRLARWQLSMGFQATNLRHERVEIDPIASRLLTNIDGTNSYDDLLQMMMDRYNQGLFKLQEDQLVEAGGLEPFLRKELNTYLLFFSRTALLEA